MYSGGDVDVLSSGNGAAGLGMAAQQQGWLHRAGVGGGDAIQ
jgi:hypothetical protein